MLILLSRHCFLANRCQTFIISSSIVVFAVLYIILLVRNGRALIIFIFIAIIIVSKIAEDIDVDWSSCFELLDVVRRLDPLNVIQILLFVIYKLLWVVIDLSNFFVKWFFIVISHYFTVVSSCSSLMIAIVEVFLHWFHDVLIEVRHSKLRCTLQLLIFLTVNTVAMFTVAIYNFTTYGVLFELIYFLGKLWFLMGLLLGCIEFIIVPDVIYELSAILGQHLFKLRQADHDVLFYHLSVFHLFDRRLQLCLIHLE